jgi:putative FmdB family regulatory protein
MPVYEYICHDCDARFEKLRPVSQSGEAASCPRCEHNAERVLSVFSSFTTNDSGMSAPISGGSACGGCSSGNCAGCAG